jgi:hypothetical protein
MTQPSMAKTAKTPVVSAAQIRMLVLSMESMSVAAFQALGFVLPPKA